MTLRNFELVGLVQSARGRVRLLCELLFVRLHKFD